MDTGTLYYVLAGVVVVAIVGRLLAFSGKRYLAGAAVRGRESAGSVASLVSMLFHLVTLGLTALLAAIPFGGSQTQVFLVRIGLLLMLVAAAYAIALRMLTARKEEAVVNDLDAQVREARYQQHPDDPSAGMAPQPQPQTRPRPTTLGEPRP